LTIVLAGYYLGVPRRYRYALLTVASYVFYGWWSAKFYLLIPLSTLIDYYAGRRV
jgi:hypothetical protein